MNSRKLSLLIAISALLFATLACVLNLGGPAYPSDRIPVSTEALTAVNQVMETAAAQSDASSGQVNVTLTEAQVTSLVAYELQQQTDPVITDPQVYLRDGQVQIYGKVATTNITATGRIIVVLSVDPEGGPKIDLTSANFGPIPIPAGLRQTITNAIRDNIRNALGSAANHVRLEKITTQDGTINMTGTLR